MHAPGSGEVSLAQNLTGIPMLTGRCGMPVGTSILNAGWFLEEMVYFDPRLGPARCGSDKGV